MVPAWHRSDSDSTWYHDIRSIKHHLLQCYFRPDYTAALVVRREELLTWVAHYSLAVESTKKLYIILCNEKVG